MRLALVLNMFKAPVDTNEHMSPGFTMIHVFVMLRIANNFFVFCFEENVWPALRGKPIVVVCRLGRGTQFALTLKVPAKEGQAGAKERGHENWVSQRWQA